ncbi:MAG TPA: DNA repair protein RadC [Candidatus Saccharimonadales bacterium]|nr:DNA repair protein RadC [Candidatus Saccharimonadales bacterium]
MPVLDTKPYLLRDNDLIVGEAAGDYLLRVRDLPSEQKPREKLLALGPKNLTVAELVAILLGVGTRKEEVLAMSQRILKEYGEKAIINETDPKNLSEALNIPTVKACQMVATFELGRRFFGSTGGRPAYVRNAKQAHRYLKDMGSLKKEQLRGLYLNSRYQVIHDEVISVGSLTANIVHPREVFQPAIEQSAVAIIIAHNHLSGVLEPTNADIEVTQQLIMAGKVLGIDVLDHLILGDNRYQSIMEIATDHLET